MPTPLQLARKKLDTSCLTLEDAKKLGITILSSAATAKLFPKTKQPSLKITYHDLDGKVRRDVYRVRLLGETPKGRFGEVPAKPLRYLQNAGAPPAAYFPRLVPWRSVVKDQNQPLVLTEGELKASCAAKFGWNCVGLGGVWNWRSAARGWALLPELQKFAWQGRDVVIAFDSDALTNPDIARATGALVKHLCGLGALPRVAELPTVKGYAKTGLDDLVFATDPDTLERVLNSAKSDELSRKLWEANERFAMVMNPGYIYEDSTGSRHKLWGFSRSLFANIHATQMVMNSDGSSKIKKVGVAKEWIEWPLRRQYKGTTYQPGKGRVVNGHLNEWSGWPYQPKKGSVTLWQELLDHVLCAATDDERHWFESWCLYPLANPGAKLHTAAGIWSDVRGVGKSFIAYTLLRVYGRNGTEINQKQLESDFNAHSSMRQFLFVDECTGDSSRHKADIMKKLITQSELWVNLKGIDQFALPDCINYYMASNRPDAFYVEPGDRRFFIHESKAGLKNSTFYKRYAKWRDSDACPEALFYHAQHFDFKGFEAHDHAPMTDSKQQMIDIVRTDPQIWVDKLRDSPDECLRIGSCVATRDLFTPEELRTFYAQTLDYHEKVSPRVFSVALRAAGFELVHVKVDGLKGRYYVARNKEKWLKATHAQCAQHIKQHRDADRAFQG